MMGTTPEGRELSLIAGYQDGLVRLPVNNIWEAGSATVSPYGCRHSWTGLV